MAPGLADNLADEERTLGNTAQENLRGGKISFPSRIYVPHGGLSQPWWSRGIDVLILVLAVPVADGFNCLNLAMASLFGSGLCCSLPPLLVSLARLDLQARALCCWRWPCCFTVVVGPDLFFSVMADGCLRCRIAWYAELHCGAICSGHGLIALIMTSLHCATSTATTMAAQNRRSSRHGCNPCKSGIPPALSVQ